MGRMLDSVCNVEDRKQPEPITPSVTAAHTNDNNTRGDTGVESAATAPGVRTTKPTPAHTVPKEVSGLLEMDAAAMFVDPDRTCDQYFLTPTPVPVFDLSSCTGNINNNCRHLY